MKKLLKVFLLSGLLSVMALAGAPAANAFDGGELGILSPDNPLIEKKMPGPPGELAPADKPPHPNGYALKVQYLPGQCRTGHAQTYCDSFKFILDNGPHIDLFYMRITLSWENPKTSAESSGVNMDLYVWDDEAGIDGQTGAIQVGQSRGTTIHPEVVKVGEPTDEDDPETEDLNESQYHITVVNYSGRNVGYTLKLEWALEDLGTFPTFSRPGGGRGIDSGSATTGSKSGSRGLPSTTGAEAPEQTEIVKVPGPDGELIEVEVPVLGAQAARRPPERTSPLVWIIAAVIVLGLGTFAFLFLRKRRHAAESAY